MTLTCSAPATLPSHSRAAASNACGLTGPDDDLGDLDRRPRLGSRRGAVAADQPAPRGFVGLDDDDRAAWPAGLDQAADQRLRHVAAADEDDVAHDTV
jgi:hypothetical protein